ncbi:predicted protein [Nematostella vectensis]|uniref:Uncharacterized protein n=1 Tax=Nematostella vectensis TaxID=45351 RepID=A7T254_NEMVE|nr:predicted protein [Nematostella vectensis]|eukprot:XP_001622060.1 predicted protein [Nematostella vectensis]
MMMDIDFTNHALSCPCIKKVQKRGPYTRDDKCPRNTRTAKSHTTTTPSTSSGTTSKPTRVPSNPTMAKVIIFVKSVQRCTALSHLLLKQNFPAICIHRGMKQEESLKGFCKHIMASLHLIVREVDQGCNIACTSKRQLWHKPKSKGKIHEPDFLKNLVLHQAKGQFHTTPDGFDKSYKKT